MTSEEFTDVLSIPGLSLVVQGNRGAIVRGYNAHKQYMIEMTEDGWKWENSPSVLPDPLPDYRKGEKTWTSTIFMMLGPDAVRLYTNGEPKIEKYFSHCCKVIIDVQISSYFLADLEQYHCGPMLVAGTGTSDILVLYFTKEVDAIQFMMLVHAKAIPNVRAFDDDKYRGKK